MNLSLNEWAQRWGVPPEALCDLALSTVYTPHEPTIGKSEAYVQSQVRLEAPHHGVYAWRNNVGAGKLQNGSFVRWGLANDSTALNREIKSADLIACRKRLITAADVGSYIGQFVSRECKRPDWKYSGTPEELAQVNWATLINSLGGDAKIVTGPGSFT